MRRKFVRTQSYLQTLENTRQVCRNYWTELKEARLEQYIGKQYFLCEYQVRTRLCVQITTPNSTRLMSRRITKKRSSSCAQVFENM